MNRLVIVGNGFDLAHGLPTGYCDFIDWYWGKVFESLKIDIRGGNFEDKFIRIHLRLSNPYYGDEKTFLLNEILKINSYETLKTFIYNIEDGHHDCEIKFINTFFKIINDKRSIQNWIDIENEYYQLLKDCLKEENNSRVTQLNKEFRQIRDLLQDYLYSSITEKYDFDNLSDEAMDLLKIFFIEPLYLEKNNEHPYLKEFQQKDYEELIQFDKSLIKCSMEGFTKSSFPIQNNLILNFNYTPVFDQYISLIDTSLIGGYKEHVCLNNTWQIQIHGQLKSPHNPINFGFGDEMDDDYKTIEKKDDNEYLRNIKSFQYLQNSNYKDMLDFIDSDKFQVYIMGHSCGLSDRILLNKIFEHNNCRSIKVFYHQFDNVRADGRTDDYTERVQNISRHFNKKEMMREKIVNKSLCQPLPQNIRFVKKENGSQS